MCTPQNPKTPQEKVQSILSFLWQPLDESTGASYGLTEADMLGTALVRHQVVGKYKEPLRAHEIT